MRPPMTTLCWSCTTTCVFSLRSVHVGPSCGSLPPRSFVFCSISRRTASLLEMCGVTLRSSVSFSRWMFWPIAPTGGATGGLLVVDRDDVRRRQHVRVALVPERLDQHPERPHPPPHQPLPVRHPPPHA